MPARKPDRTVPARRVRLFRNSRNQALRIPREVELTADEAVIYRDERRVVAPVRRAPTLATVLSRLTPLDDDFPTITDPPAHPEDVL